MTLGLKIGSDLQTKKCAIGIVNPVQYKASHFLSYSRKNEKKKIGTKLFVKFFQL